MTVVEAEELAGQDEVTRCLPTQEGTQAFEAHLAITSYRMGISGYIALSPQGFSA